MCESPQGEVVIAPIGMGENSRGRVFVFITPSVLSFFFPVCLWVVCSLSLAMSPICKPDSFALFPISPFILTLIYILHHPIHLSLPSFHSLTCCWCMLIFLFLFQGSQWPHPPCPPTPTPPLPTPLPPAPSTRSNSSSWPRLHLLASPLHLTLDTSSFEHSPAPWHVLSWPSTLFWFLLFPSDTALSIRGLAKNLLKFFHNSGWKHPN